MKTTVNTYQTPKTSPATRLLGYPSPIASIAAEVQFGTLTADGDCVHMGICKIDLPTKWMDGALRCAAAPVRITWHGGNKMCFCFRHCDVSACAAAHYLGSPLFELPQRFVFPQNICTALRLSGLIVIPSGFYPIVRTKSTWLVLFDVDTKSSS